MPTQGPVRPSSTANPADHRPNCDRKSDVDERDSRAQQQIQTNQGELIRACPKCQQQVTRLIAIQRRTQQIEVVEDGSVQVIAELKFEQPVSFCCPHCLRHLANNFTEAWQFLGR
jgi:hypothetical protein